MKRMRKSGGHIWTDYKTNMEIAKEINITQVLDSHVVDLRHVKDP